jgi:hypothetical protein
MDRQPHSSTREVIVAKAIESVVAELRLVDLADYVAFIRLERFASIADLVDSAAELYFMPGTLKLGHGGEVHISWSGPARILLDLELRPKGATVFFTLSLEDVNAGVEVNYVSFDKPAPDPSANTAFLQRALAEARIRKSEAA